MNDGVNIIGALFLIAIVSIIGLALATFNVWLGIDVVAGHDLSFREALGGGIILASITSAINLKP